MDSVAWGAGLKTELRLIVFHKGELVQNGSAVRKLRELGSTLVERSRDQAVGP